MRMEAVENWEAGWSTDMYIGGGAEVVHDDLVLLEELGWSAAEEPRTRKRKRGPDPDPDPKPNCEVHLIGSVSKYPGAQPSTISFKQQQVGDQEDSEAIQQMKEMIYRAAAFRPVNLGVEAAERPRRKNVRISTDPQTVAARQRRERISDRLRVLQKLVPGGSKMDTASMLDEAANYLKFLTSQVKALQAMHPSSNPPLTFNFSNSYYFSMQSHPQYANTS